MKKLRYGLFLLPIFLIGWLVGHWLFHKDPTFTYRPAPSAEYLQAGISNAQWYYEGLYRTLDNKGAVITEYYSVPKSVYTMRHATIGGYYYFDHIGDATKSAELKRFITDNGFTPGNDEHSFIWLKKSTASAGVVFSPLTYHDCAVKLPSNDDILSYHSKVCKLGEIGIYGYILASRFDPFVPMTNSLQEMEEGKKIDPSQLKWYENTYNGLGFGMPMCTPFGCSSTASTIRTAQFGEIELRLGNMKYADAVANELLHAQNDKGAIYLSFDKDGNLKQKKPLIYSVIDSLFNEKPIYTGFIPTNAESMNDSLAFLLHYQCAKYGVCK